MPNIYPLNNTTTLNNASASQFTEDKWRIQNEEKKIDDTKNTGTNPYSKLDKNAFLKLLLTELQHQDPTEPMDSAKMLEQTSQLATLEMQENTNKIMSDLGKQMQSSLSMTAMSVLGKIANLSNSVSKDSVNSQVDFTMHFDKDIKSGEIQIYNSKNEIVKTIPLAQLKAGANKFRWDGTDTSGASALPGEYTVKAKFTDKDGKAGESLLGQYPVEAVKFAGSQAYIKVADQYIKLDQVREFTEPKTVSQTHKPENTRAD